MDVKLQSTKDIQLLIDFIACSYSQEDMFSLGRNIGIDKSSYHGFGMNNIQLADAFVTKVIQLSRGEELINLMRNHKTLKRPKLDALFGVEAFQQSTVTKSILDSVYAIIIGVEDYSNVDYFDSLTYSGKDAQNITDLILNQWGVDSKKVYLFNQSGDTTYKTIRPVLDSVIPNLTEDDNLFFYFSGHGDEVNGNSFLILSDTTENNLSDKYENAIELSELNDLFKQCEAKIKFRIFDACKCGQSFSKGKIKSMTPKLKSDMFGSGIGWITFTSCNITESSYEDPQFQNGTFTHFLIEGMRGKAKRGQGKMHIEDLKIYVFDNVPKNTYYKQNPQYHCEIEGNVFIE